MYAIKNSLLMIKNIMPLFVAFVLCSCGNASSKYSDGCDSDSVAFCDESGELNVNFDYKHPDAQMSELFGNVKSMILTKYLSVGPDGEIIGSGDSYVDRKLYFKRDGEFDLANEDFEWGNPRFQRNSEGQITKVTRYIEDFDCDIYEAYEYDELGMVKKCEGDGIESNHTVTFKYDDNTNLISAHLVSTGEGMICDSKITYTILKTDDRQNWTRRIVKNDEKSGEVDGPDGYTETNTYYELETREIEYYE